MCSLTPIELGVENSHDRLVAVSSNPPHCLGLRSSESCSVYDIDRSSTQTACGRQKTSEPLLVTLLDGKIAAIDKENGSTVWVFDTNTALISARGSKGYAFTVVPGVQGELYTQAKGSQAGFQVWNNTYQVVQKSNLKLH